LWGQHPYFFLKIRSFSTGSPFYKGNSKPTGCMGWGVGNTFFFIPFLPLWLGRGGCLSWGCQFWGVVTTNKPCFFFFFSSSFFPSLKTTFSTASLGCFVRQSTGRVKSGSTNTGDPINMVRNKPSWVDKLLSASGGRGPHLFSRVFGTRPGGSRWATGLAQ